MTTPTVRRDVRRNRVRILDAARRTVDSGRALQLNDVAKNAELGVATVYRHFPTPNDLLEALATDSLQALLNENVITGEVDPWADLTAFLHAGVAAQLDDPALASVLSSPTTSPLRPLLVVRLDSLLSRVRARQHLAAEFDGADLLALVCGVVTAARSHASAHGEAPTSTAHRYLDILLTGVLVA